MRNPYFGIIEANVKTNKTAYYSLFALHLRYKLICWGGTSVIHHQITNTGKSHHKNAVRRKFIFVFAM